MEASPATPAVVRPSSPADSTEASSVEKGDTPLKEMAPDADSAEANSKGRLKRQEKEHARALRKVEEHWRAQLKAQAERNQQEHSKAIEQVVKRAEEVVLQTQARARSKQAALAAEIKSLQEKLSKGPETHEEITPPVPLNNNPLYRRASTTSELAKEEALDVETRSDGQSSVSDVQKCLDAAEVRTLELAAKLLEAENEVGLLNVKVEEADRRVKVAERRVQDLEQEQTSTTNMLKLAAEKVQGLEQELGQNEARAEALRNAEEVMSELGKNQYASEQQAAAFEMEAKELMERLTVSTSKVASLEKELARAKTRAEESDRQARERLESTEAKVLRSEKELAAVKSDLQDLEGKRGALELRLQAAEEELNIERTKVKELTAVESQLKDLEGKKAALAMKVQEAEEGLNMERKKVKELTAVKSELEDLEEKKVALETRLQSVEKELSVERTKVKDLTAVRNALRHLEEEKAALAAKVQDAERELGAERTRVKELESEAKAQAEKAIASSKSLKELKAQLSADKEKVRSLEGKLFTQEEALKQSAGPAKDLSNGVKSSESEEDLRRHLEASKERNAALEKSLSVAESRSASESEKIWGLEARVKEGDGRLKEAEMHLAESNERASKTAEEVAKLRNWCDKVEASLQALQCEKAEKESQLSDALRELEHLRNALAAERANLSAQRNHRESDVAMLVRQVSSLQQQLLRAEDVKNLALRQHSQNEEHLMREVDDLKQQMGALMGAKKSFCEVTLEGELAQLKGRAEDAAVWRTRLAEAERRLQDAEYREQKHLSALAGEEDKVVQHQETIRHLEQQLEATEKGEGELEATIIDVTDRVQAAERQAAETAAKAQELQEALALKEQQLASTEEACGEVARKLKKAQEERGKATAQLEEAMRKLKAATEAATPRQLFKQDATDTSTEDVASHPRTLKPDSVGPKLRKRSQGGKEKRSSKAVPISNDWELLDAAQKQNHAVSHGVPQVALYGIVSSAAFAAGVAATCQLGICPWLPF